MEKQGKITIGICDDHDVFVRLIYSMVNSFCEKRSVSAKIVTFSSGEEVIPFSKELDVLFLDIEMPGMDGISAGKIIKEKNSDCKIIMSTSHVERFKEAFKIQAFRFVTKPINKEEMEEALTEIIDEKCAGIEAFYKREKYALRQQDIMYVEAYNGYVLLNVFGKEFRKDISVDELDKELNGKWFIRVSRTHIINLRFIKELTSMYAEMETCRIKISRRRWKEVEQKYIMYDLQYGRV